MGETQFSMAAQLKEEIKAELKSELKSELKAELEDEVDNQLEDEVDNQLEVNAKLEAELDVEFELAHLDASLNAEGIPTLVEFEAQLFAEEERTQGCRDKSAPWYSSYSAKCKKWIGMSEGFCLNQERKWQQRICKASCQRWARSKCKDRGSRCSEPWGRRGCGGNIDLLCPKSCKRCAALENLGCGQW